jgi:hypothetical protein
MSKIRKALRELGENKVEYPRDLHTATRAEFVTMARKSGGKKDGCFKNASLGIFGLSLFTIMLINMFGARTKRDGLKRWCAQSLNSMAKAVLDVNNVYMEFKGVHEEHATYLANLMVRIAQDREALVSFCKETWGLDEQQIMSYI